MKPFTPRPWQVPAIEHLLEHRRAALWKPMGSGKTADVLTATDTLNLAAQEDVYPALALGPLRVARKVWREEAGKWVHTKGISVSQIIGDADTRGFIVDRLCNPGNNLPHEIYTVNYDVVPWLEEKLAGRMPFRTIIADESRKLGAFRVKQGGAQAAAIGRMAWHKNVTRFWELTGTPAPNGLRDLWGQLWMLDKGQRLGLTFSAFEEKYFAFKRMSDALSHKSSVQAVIQPGADEDIRQRVKDICLSIDLRDYIDIREPFHRAIKVAMPPPARKLYDEMEKKLFIEIEGHEIEAFSAAAKSQKLLQLANGAAYLDPLVESEEEPGARAWKEVHTAKLEALDSIIDEMGDVPIIVAYNFKSDLARLLKAYPNGRGRHLSSEKDEDDFKAGRIPLLFAHPKSAGHGIDGFQNVTNVLVFFSTNWDLELRQQMIERIGPTRQMQSGFDRPVFIYDIIAEQSIDEVVLARHETKRSVQDLLLEAVKHRRQA